MVHRVPRYSIVVVRFILQYCSGKEYKGMASSVSDITSSNTYYLHYILPPIMVHTSRSYQYASYEEFRDNGMFSSEANCMQFLYDMKILRTQQKCPSCNIPMTLTECSRDELLSLPGSRFRILFVR